MDRILKPKGHHKEMPIPPPSNEERIRKFNSENPGYEQPYNANVEYYLNELSGVALNVITERSWHVGEETINGLQQVVDLGKFLQANDLTEIRFFGKTKAKAVVRWKPFFAELTKFYDSQYPGYATFVLPSKKGTGQPKGQLLTILIKGYSVILSLHMFGVSNHFLSDMFSVSLETFTRTLKRAEDSITSKR